MPARRDAVLLRIVVGQYAFHDKKPLAECILLKAREMNLQSGTILQSRMGFTSVAAERARNALHGAWDTPLVLELVDSPERISAFLVASEALLGEARITAQEVTSIVRE